MAKHSSNKDDFKLSTIIFGLLALPLVLVGALIWLLVKIIRSRIRKASQEVPAPQEPEDISVILERYRAPQKVREIRFADSLSSIPQVEIDLSPGTSTHRPVSEMPPIQTRNIIRSIRLSSIFPLVVIDLETTGLSARTCEIIEVAAIRFDYNFEPVSCFTTLLRPKKPIPAAVSAINHITDDMVSGKPTFAEIIPAFSSYISECSIVGHNLIFDLKFLYAYGVDLPEKARYYDTLKLAKYTLTTAGSKKWNSETGSLEVSEDYDVENYQLDTLCDYYRIYRAETHRALSDCLATGMLLQCLIEDKTS